jgi:hypothetical protein
MVPVSTVPAFRKGKRSCDLRPQRFQLLVGGAITILKNMRQLGWLSLVIPYIMDSKIHVPNHQPDVIFKFM